jgi:hypothetical protein
MKSMPVMQGGERAEVRQSPRCKDVVGLLKYLDWREEYDQSDKEGQLGFLFCMAFDIDSEIRDIEDDLIADSLIRSTYCYDDFIHYE